MTPTILTTNYFGEEDHITWGQGQGGQSFLLQRRKSRVANSIRITAKKAATITTWRKVCWDFEDQLNAQRFWGPVERSPGLGRLLGARGEYWVRLSLASLSRCNHNTQNLHWWPLWNIIVISSVHSSQNSLSEGISTLWVGYFGCGI